MTRLFVTEYSEKQHTQRDPGDLLDIFCLAKLTRIFFPFSTLQLLDSPITTIPIQQKKKKKNEKNPE